MSDKTITGVWIATNPHTQKPKCKECSKPIIKGEETVSVGYISGKWQHIAHYHPQCSEEILKEAVEQSSKVFQETIKAQEEVENLLKSETAK